jgi:hypothetical protein
MWCRCCLRWLSCNFRLWIFGLGLTINFLGGCFALNQSLATPWQFDIFRLTFGLHIISAHLLWLLLVSVFNYDPLASLASFVKYNITQESDLASELFDEDVCLTIRCVAKILAFD